METKIVKFKIGVMILLGSWLVSSNKAYAETIGQDSLNHYLQVAARSNPGLKADFLTYKAAIQHISQAGAYPDPELDMGFFLEPMDILGGKQVAEFKIMQMFPWFGTKKSAHNEAAHRAQMAFERFRENRNSLYLDIYAQWYRLCDLQERLVNNKANKELLKQLESLALQKYGSGDGQIKASQGKMNTAMGKGSSKMSDVLRIQIELAGIDNNIESVLSQLAAEKVKFNALLGRPSEAGISLPDSLKQVSFLLNESSVLANIERQNPMLKMLLEEGLSYKAQAETEKKKSYPMMGVGLQYMLNKKTDNQAFAMGSMNGKDMWMPMVSMSIPIFRNKYKAEQREIRFRQEASKENYENTLNNLEADYFRIRQQLDDANRKIGLYQRQSQLAESAYRLVVEEFTSGQSDLTNVIDVQRQLLDYQLKTADAIADYNTKAAAIQKLISFKDTEF